MEHIRADGKTGIPFWVQDTGIPSFFLNGIPNISSIPNTSLILNIPTYRWYRISTVKADGT